MSLTLTQNPAPLSHEYDATLASATDIADYLLSLNPEMDHEFIESYFEHTHAILTPVPTYSLREGDSDHNLRDEDKECEFLRLNPQTLPPLVVEDGVICDGNHRFRVAKALGLTTLWVYVVTESPFC